MRSIGVQRTRRCRGGAAAMNDVQFARRIDAYHEQIFPVDIAPNSNTVRLFQLPCVQLTCSWMDERRRRCGAAVMKIDVHHMRRETRALDLIALRRSKATRDRQLATG